MDTPGRQGKLLSKCQTAYILPIKYFFHERCLVENNSNICIPDDPEP